MCEISIITINYNNSVGLLKTINSVINQSERKLIEYIVIDGGSTDGSGDIIKEHSERIDYWVSEKDRGIYDAMNKGIKQAKGNYLMFLNSGDCLYDKQTLGICLSAIKSNTQIDIFYGNIISVDERLTHLYRLPEKVQIDFLKENNLNHQASLIKANLFTQFGLYPEKYKLAADHWLYLVSMVGDKVFKHIDEPLVIYDSTGLSVINRAKYDLEMAEMWQTIVPEYVKEFIRTHTRLESEFSDLAFETKKRFVKLAIKLHYHIYSFKKKLK